MNRRVAVGVCCGLLLILRFANVKLWGIDPRSVSSSRIGAFEHRFCEWTTNLWLQTQLSCKKCVGSRCHPLPIVRNECGINPRQIAWDPQSQTSSYNKWTLHSDGHTYTDHPVCTLRTCWNLHRCADIGPMTVYVPQASFTALNASILEYAIKHHLIKVVHEERENACVVLLADGMYNSIQNFTEALKDGQNRLVWDASQMRFPQEPHVRLSGDDAFPSFHMGKSMVATVALTGATHVRHSYDIPLPLPRKWGHLPSGDQNEQNRTFLLTFRGQWKNRGRPYYLHRWIAYAYWENREDVYVDLKCVKYRFGGLWQQIVKDYDESRKLSYDQLLYNSTFGFAPGGSGPGSFRFGEILSAGGIPVVVPDTILPFWPALDWSPCVVQVSESCLVDLPQILRNMTNQDITRRQYACRKLMRLAYGDILDPRAQRYVSDPKQIFFTAMSILRIRIQHAKSLLREAEGYTIVRSTGK